MWEATKEAIFHFAEKTPWGQPEFREGVPGGRCNRAKDR
jgi:hypothetical protein